MLEGVRVLEIEGQGPAPFCGMLFADLGADVILVSRSTPSDTPGPETNSLINRGKRSIALDLKDQSDREILLQLVGRSHVLLEGFRPGVMERLGLGPRDCHARNPSLVYGRMTGWGQSGPMASEAGHDLNYVALSGALWYSSVQGEAPNTPPTLQGDVPGALYLAIGVLSAVINARQTNRGDVVDVAIVDCVAHMQNLLLSLRQMGELRTERGQSLLDGPHWTRTYKCLDDKWISVQCLEPKFYRSFLRCMGLEDDAVLRDQFARDRWQEQSEYLASIIVRRTRDEWMTSFAGADACVAPVLSLDEAIDHEHMRARNSFVAADGVVQGARAPKFASESNWTVRKSPTRDEHRSELLRLIEQSVSNSPV